VLTAFSNPKLPQDEINVSDKRPLADFFILSAGLVAAAGALALLLMLFAQTIAGWLPFSVERALADRYFAEIDPPSEAETELRRIATSLLASQPLPAGVSITVHYRPQPVANATATLGGHITIYRGLIEAVDSENALALVLAHEIAHVRHRDPVQALGRGLAFAVVLSAVSAGAGSQAVEWFAGSAGAMTALSFNRAQESRADADALAAVAARYGHVYGAEAFFAEMQRRMSAAGNSDAAPVFLRTHPATDDRLQRLAELARAQGWRATGELTPLPAALQAIRDARKAQPGGN
jgi:beta-barrel assembly-enhancing protease